MKKLYFAVLAGTSALALAGCGADDVVAPNGDIVVNPGPGGGGGGGGGVTPGTVTAAAACTPGTTDRGTIVLKDNKGTIRNCEIPGPVITTNLTLSGRRADGIMYSLSGRTDVGSDVRLGGTAATLTIFEGVTVFGLNPESSLVVNRGSRLNATGSAGQPIIFTAIDNLRNPAAGAISEVTAKLWGGIVINGQAPVSDCQPTAGSTSTVGGNTNCWRQAEGYGDPRPVYGGSIAADNSGTLSFVQINFGGQQVAAADEINSLTLNGVGSGTTINNVQVHNGQDDGLEIFGGTVNARRIVLTGNADDSLDVDNGYRGAIQYLLAVNHGTDQPGGDGNAAEETLLEVDSNPSASNRADASPRTFLKLANFTFIQNKPLETSVRIRGGADVALLNGVIASPNTAAQGCFDVDHEQTVNAAAGTDVYPGDVAGVEAGPPILRSVLFTCTVLADPDVELRPFEQDTLSNPQNSQVNTSFTDALLFLTGSSVGRVVTPTTTATSVANLKTDATIGDPFFDQANYIGAFSGVGDNWTVGWTCNSKLVDLRGATNCTELRIS